MTTLAQFVDAYPFPMAVFALVGFATVAKFVLSLLKVAYENHALKGVNVSYHLI
jgi:hypothetical protein